MTLNQFVKKCMVARNTGCAKLSDTVELAYWSDTKEYSIRQLSGLFWNTVATNYDPLELFYLVEN